MQRARVLINGFKLLIALPVLLIFLIQIMAPGIIRRQIRQAGLQNCPTCRLQISRLSFSVFTRRLELSEIDFSAGTPGVSNVRADIRRIVADLSLKQLLLGTLKFNWIEIHSPTVILYDGDEHLPPQPPKPPSAEKIQVFSVTSIKVFAGTFEYKRTYQGKLARLKVSDIDANVNEFGNTPKLKVAEVRAHALARLQDSGAVDLEIKTFLFDPNIRADIDLKVSGQDLSELKYFEDNDGIRLAGKLIKGRGRVTMFNDDISARVFAKYQDFDLEFLKTAQRSGAKTFFSNLGASLVMDSRNDEEQLADQSREVQIKKRPRENVVGFILRSLKEAALKIVKF